MDKKVVITLLIVAVVGFSAVFFGYRYMADLPLNGQNSTGNVQPDQPEVTDQNSGDNLDVQLPAGGVEYETENGGGSLTICRYECGDGTCQESNSNCAEGAMDCICLETPQDCPQDCSN